MANIENITSAEHVEKTLQMKIRNLKTEAVLEKINSYKAKLRLTDYQAIKFSEGELSEAEYQPIKLQRREWRAEINLLEAELKEINRQTEV